MSQGQSNVVSLLAAREGHESLAEQRFGALTGAEYQIDMLIEALQGNRELQARAWCASYQLQFARTGKKPEGYAVKVEQFTASEEREHAEVLRNYQTEYSALRLHAMKYGMVRYLVTERPPAGEDEGMEIKVLATCHELAVAETYLHPQGNGEGRTQRLVVEIDKAIEAANFVEAKKALYGM